MSSESDSSTESVNVEPLNEESEAILDTLYGDGYISNSDRNQIRYEVLEGNNSLLNEILNVVEGDLPANIMAQIEAASNNQEPGSGFLIHHTQTVPFPSDPLRLNDESEAILEELREQGYINMTDVDQVRGEVHYGAGTFYQEIRFVMEDALPHEILDRILAAPINHPVSGPLFEINNIITELNLEESPIFTDNMKQSLVRMWAEFDNNAMRRTIIRFLGDGGDFREILTDLEASDINYILTGEQPENYISENSNDDLPIIQNEVSELPRIFVPSPSLKTCYVLNFPSVNNLLVYDTEGGSDTTFHDFISSDLNKIPIIFILFHKELEGGKGKYFAYGSDLDYLLGGILDETHERFGKSLPTLTAECKKRKNNTLLKFDDMHVDKVYSRFLVGAQDNVGVLISKILAIPKYLKKDDNGNFMPLFLFLTDKRKISVPGEINLVKVGGGNSNISGRTVDDETYFLPNYCRDEKPITVYDEIFLADVTTLNSEVSWSEKGKIIDSGGLPSICGF